MMLEVTIAAISEQLPGWTWLVRSGDDDEGEGRAGRFLGHVMPPGFTGPGGGQSFSAWRRTAEGALEDAYSDAIKPLVAQNRDGL